jgi:hypothetical protein
MTALDVQSDDRNDRDERTHGEPWGQQGVLGMAGPALAKISVLCIFISCLLWYRSQTTWDRFEWSPPGRSIELANVMGRVKLMVSPREGRYAGGAQFDSSYIPSNVRDGWEPGLAKTIGFEVTSEFDSRGQPATVLRIRWHFIIAVLALYPAVFFVRQWRRARAREEAMA